MSEKKKNNPVGINGIEFVEFTSPEPQKLDQLFKEFGFSKLKKHKDKNIDYYNQNDIHFLLNRENQGFAHNFSQIHGPSIASMGWRVEDAQKARDIAVQRGAQPCDQSDYTDANGHPLPAIYGIGESLIYFIDQYNSPDKYEKMGFVDLEAPEQVPDKGFLTIDHLTNNVPQGTMEKWSKFYKEIFGFEEVRYFDIRGIKTGLTSYALRSPCGKFSIPINEGTEEKSQINEYLREYNGAGIQHLAFLTEDIIHSVKSLKGTSIQTLDIDKEYYDEVFDRVPNVSEDHKTLEELNILVDGDNEGYLLQIFTKNLIGPIFIEIIQRKNHFSFGEGNFGALFRSIERDQEKRGVL
ncbi:MAG: 4-hydroxyphenylpyruvate dioxygenase [Bdellovibrio sp.]|nr:MAG: 4-hydroxyphenylpyruvate dioxygenase [Bdellovibrio sp.]